MLRWISLDRLRFVFVSPSDFRWMLFGPSLDVLWFLFGFPLDYRWCFVGFSLDLLRFLFGLPSAFLLVPFVFPLIPLRVFAGFHLISFGFSF